MYYGYKTIMHIKFKKWLKLKRLTIPKVGNDVEKLELLYTLDGNVKWYNHFVKLWAVF